MDDLPEFTICGADQLSYLTEIDFACVISIRDHVWCEERAKLQRALSAVHPRARIHLAFFDDMDARFPGYTLPTTRQVREILQIGAGLRARDRVLVHCWAGISRSPAIAYALACQIAGAGREAEVFAWLLSQRPQMLPNRLIVRLADDVLGRNGAMTRVVERHRRAWFGESRGGGEPETFGQE